MKNTIKHYNPQVMYKGFREGQWTHIMRYDWNGGKTFAITLQEAKDAIEKTRVHQQSFGDAFEIVATRILTREVTEWEIMEE